MTEFIKNPDGFNVDPAYQKALAKIGIDSFDSVFTFAAGKSLTKSNLASYRQRIQLELTDPPTTLFLKRYDHPPFSVQMKNRLNHKKNISLASIEAQNALSLNNNSINAPKIICYGCQMAGCVEKRSFLIMEKIPDAASLETSLPSCFDLPMTSQKRNEKIAFLKSLADFIARFHSAGFCHRDLYLCHIFYDSKENFHLIDVARAFKPTLFRRRYVIKDITQMYYSSPADKVSRTDRLRFYLYLNKKSKLEPSDKAFIKHLLKKARKMAIHDKKHNRDVPFERRS